MKIDMSALEFRQLNKDDIDLVMELQDKIIAGLTDPEILRRNDRELMLQSISDNNTAIGVFDPAKSGHLVAIAIMVDAKGTPEDLSIGLEKHTVSSSINMKSVMVLPDYRGNGLQKYLTKQLEERAKAAGYTHVCLSIYPNNKYSMNNALAMGYEYDHTATKYGGMVRDILVKTL